MATHIALLRGINVGGHNRVSMTDLRALMTSMGHTDVATYIQSGNAVFTTGETDTAALAAALERGIAGNLGVSPRVVVISRAELAETASANPFPDEPNPKCVHAVFFRSTPGPELAAQIRAAMEQVGERSGDRAEIAGSAMFLHTPNGYGRSDLAVLLQRPGTPAAAGTARNWSTVTKLLAMCGD